MSSRTARSRRRPPSAPAPPSRRRWLQILLPVALALAVAGIVIGVHQATSSGPGAPDTSNLQYVDVAKRDLAGLPSQGNVVGFANAPVTVTEFGDLRCPVCREWSAAVLPDVLHKLVRTHRVKLAYEHWPILGPNSVYAGRAAYAAAQQSRLWLYAEITYFNQGDEQVDWFTQDVARSIAAAAGLDLSRFDRDFGDTAAATRETNRANQIATQRGYSGTPSFHVAGPTGSVNLTGSVPTYGDIAAAVRKVGGRT